MDQRNATQESPRGLPRRWMRRARSRGVLFTEYLIVTATVFLVISAAFYAVGPKIAAHAQEVIQLVAQKAP